MRCNKNEKKYLRAHFSMLTGPFKQTRVGGGGHRAMVSHWGGGVVWSLSELREYSGSIEYHYEI
jgi:hypothetical protein